MLPDHLLAVAAPDLRRDADRLVRAVRIGQLQDHRHHQPTHVLEGEPVDVVVEALRRAAVGVGAPGGAFGIPALLGRGREAVGLVVEVPRRRVALDHGLDAAIVLDCARDRLAFKPLAGRAVADLGIGRFQRRGGHALQRDVDVVGGIEPAAPEPVEVDARTLLHGAEEVIGGGAFEGPALRIFAEGAVEQLAAQDGFTQDHQRRRRLGIGVVAELEQAVGLGHDRHLVLTDHVFDDAGRLAAGREVGVPELFGLELQEAVQPLVHPGPLPLVRVDDHREIGVADLVDDHADQAVLGAFGIGQATVVPPHRARPVEGDHRIFHPADRAVDRLGRGIGVGKGELVVDVDGVGDRAGRIGVPQRPGLLRIEGHGHDDRIGGAVLLDAHGVPDEFARTGPAEVADIVGAEIPGAGSGSGRAGLGGGSLGRGDDIDRRVGGARPGQTRALFGAQDVGVGQFAGGGHDMVDGGGDRDVIVAELQGELAGPEELGIMPALIVRIDRQTREPLGRQEDAVAILAGLGETLIAAAAADDVGFGQRQAEVDVEGKALAGRQRARQFDPHHRVDDGEGQGLAVRAGDLHVVEAALPVLHPLHPQHLIDADGVGGRVGPAALGQRGAAIVLLVEQQPEIAQGVGGVVGVGHRLATRQRPARLVQRHVDVIVDLLLPVAEAGGPGGVAIVRRGRPVLALELAEFVLERALGLVDRPDALLGQGGRSQEGNAGDRRQQQTDPHTKHPSTV